MHVIADVGDIPEDLPDGEVGTDLDVPEQVAKVGMAVHGGDTKT